MYLISRKRTAALPHKQQQQQQPHQVRRAHRSSSSSFQLPPPASQMSLDLGNSPSTSAAHVPLTLIENLNLPASPKPRRQDFVQLRRKSSVSAVYPLSLYCRVQAYDEWMSTLSHQLVYRWRPARVIEIDDEDEDGDGVVRVLVAFDGFSSRWDAWVSLESGMLRCPLAGGPVAYQHRTYLPRVMEDDASAAASSTSGEVGFSSPRLMRSVSTTSSLNVEFEDEEDDECEASAHLHDGQSEPEETPPPQQAAAVAVPASRIKTPFFLNSTSGAPPSSLSTTTPLQLLTTTRGVSGLSNLGNTCFMNAILQSLSFTPPFTIALLRLLQQQQAHEQSPSMASELGQLLREQWRLEPAACRSPVALRAELAKKLPHLFATSRQQDAQEFLCLLLDLLHESNNRIRRKPSYVKEDDDDEDEDDEGNEDEDVISARSWSTYERGSDSFVKDLFCGQFMSRKRCSQCGKKTSSCDVFFDLQVPLVVAGTTTTTTPSSSPSRRRSALGLASVVGGASSSFSSSSSSSASSASSALSAVRVEDLLNAYFKPERMADVQCGKCKAVGGITRQLAVHRLPYVLVIMFKRSLSQSEKVHTAVSFPRKGLKIRSSGSRVYDLVSVVNHHGTHSAAGHYTCSVVHPLSGHMYQADDAKFTALVDQQHAQSVVSKDAFMLFYVDREELSNSADFIQCVAQCL